MAFSVHPSSTLLARAALAIALCANSMITALPGKPLQIQNDIKISTTRLPHEHDHPSSFRERSSPKPLSEWSRYKEANNKHFEHTAAAITATPSVHSLLEKVKEPSGDSDSEGLSPKLDRISLTKDNVKKGKQKEAPNDPDWGLVYPTGRRARSVKILRKQAAKVSSWHDSIAEIEHHHRTKDFRKATELHKELKKTVKDDVLDVETDRALKRFENPTTGVVPPSMKENDQNIHTWRERAKEAAPSLARVRLEEASRKYIISSPFSSSPRGVDQNGPYKQEVRKHLNNAINGRLYGEFSAGHFIDAKHKEKFPAYFDKLHEANTHAALGSSVPKKAKKGGNS